MFDNGCWWLNMVENFLSPERAKYLNPGEHPGVKKRFK